MRTLSPGSPTRSRTRTTPWRSTISIEPPKSLTVTCPPSGSPATRRSAWIGCVQLAESVRLLPTISITSAACPRASFTTTMSPAPACDTTVARSAPAADGQDAATLQALCAARGAEKRTHSRSARGAREPAGAQDDERFSCRNLRAGWAEKSWAREEQTRVERRLEGESETGETRRCVAFARSMGRCDRFRQRAPGSRRVS